MAGSHRVEAKSPGTLNELCELQVAIALDARIRGVSEAMGLRVWHHHRGVELVDKVEHVMVDPQPRGHPPGVLDVGDRAASRVACTPPQLHGRADYLVTCLKQERGSHRGVHTAR